MKHNFPSGNTLEDREAWLLNLNYIYGLYSVQSHPETYSLKNCTCKNIGIIN